jgi:hypothetical protein
LKRGAFLPVFFIVLGVVFAGAVWLRLSAYQSANGATLPATTSSSSAPNVATQTTTMEIVTENATDDANSSEATKSVSAAARARQERYNELLRSAAPSSQSSSAATPPPPPPSLITRVANALGINKTPKPQPQPMTPRPASQTQGQRASGDSHNPDEPGPREKPREDVDPETDVEPPRLISADFTPQQVQDDGETILGVRATDNLSGVRSVSGVIASPSGALQGFACQREGEGSDRFIARIRVPRDAAEGTWAVKYLTLSDNANNSVNLNQAAGALPASAQFKVVSGSSDSKAPELRAVYLERRSMSAGERNTVFVTAEDDKSGVSLVSGVFVSPSKQARIGFGCKPGQGGAWECTIAPPVCLDCGAWALEQIQVQDKANNMATFRSDNQMVAQITLDISGDKCDSGPPAITQLQVEPLVVSNTEGGTINISAVVQDDSCGVASLSGQAIPTSSQGAGQKIYFSFDPSPDGQNFFGRIAVPRHAAKGIWAISWIQALDKGHNLKAYSTQDPVLARVTFRVE